MATAHSPFQPGDALFGFSSEHWSDETCSAWTDNFEVMPEYELDYLFEEFERSNAHQQSFDSRDTSDQDALPAGSSSPEDINESNPQFTPSSTADDSPGEAEHSDHTSFELVSNHTDSPAENFEEASLMNSDFSNHSPVSQRVLPASDATLSSSQQSREPSNEATWGSREQDWSSSLSASSEGHAPATSPYNRFVMTESTDTISDNLLADMNIPFRVSQPSEQWTTPALQSTTWGNLQHPMFPVQQQPDLASSIPIPSAQGAVLPASPPPTQISDIASGQDSYDGREAQSSAHPWAPLLPGGSVPQSGCIDPRVITHTGSWNEQDHHNHRRGHQDTVCTASSSCSYKIRYGFH
jgi:hypothetical protein